MAGQGAVDVNGPGGLRSADGGGTVRRARRQAEDWRR